MRRIVADIGNSRLKWGLVAPTGALVEIQAMPVDDPSAWDAAWSAWSLDAGPTQWAISSVNPTAADLLAERLQQWDGNAHWFRSAADVPQAHRLATSKTTGADRALGVLAATCRHPGPGQVVLCGTAVTIEHIDSDSIWQGGAIAPGLGLSARALHMLTAQLPLVSPPPEPPALGNATVPALEAGVFWSVVGGIRELLQRQSATNLEPGWTLWAGGDAAVLAAAVGWPGSVVVPELVLEGLARAIERMGESDDAPPPTGE